MPIHKGETIEVPVSLLRDLLAEGTFNGDLSRDEDADRGATYIVAASEGLSLLKNANTSKEQENG